MKKMLRLFSIVLAILIFFVTTPILAQRGCCSWHGGVSGCDSNTGKLLCSDGTDSPTCACPSMQQTSAFKYLAPKNLSNSYSVLGNKICII